jgi:hypothetical protein
MLVFSEIRGAAMKKHNPIYPLIGTMVEAGYSTDKIFFHIKKSGMNFSARELRAMIGKVYKRMMYSRRVGV